MNINDVRMGELVKNWQDGRAMSATLCVTEACNLACTYCYMTNKDYQKKMSLETGMKIIDFILENEEMNKSDALILDFIGGEPLLEIELISKLSDYLVYRLYTTNHKWFDKYRFVITTNGLLYLNEDVQKYIKKYNGHLSLTISLDGTPEKQNLSRVKRDGTGSYDDVVKSIPLWIKQFPNASTKSTFSHEDLPYLCDSIIHLWNLGIKNVMANIVYEDVWVDGDEELFENQLRKLADYIAENDLWDKYSVRFFNPNVGLPLTKEHKMSNVCGAGKKTVAFDCDGNIFPCIRFIDFCTEHKVSKKIGDLDTGINPELIKPYSQVAISTVVDTECDNCDVSKSCDFCTAFNYIASSQDSVYERTKFNCKIHKANVRANEYLWYLFSKKTGLTSLRTIAKVSDDESEVMKYLFFITADNIIPHCGYKTKKESEIKMSKEVFEKGMEYCYRNSMIPIFLGKMDHGFKHEKNLHVDVFPPEQFTENDEDFFRTIMSHESGNIDKTRNSAISSLCFDKDTLENLYDDIVTLFGCSKRVNIYPKEIVGWADDDFVKYQEVMIKVAEYIKFNRDKGKVFSLNVLSDNSKFDFHNSCGAGKTSLALAPDGELYYCPAFYFAPTEYRNSLGNIFETSFYPGNPLLKNSRLPFCSSCDKNACQICVYENVLATGEMGTPASNYCRYMNINVDVSNKLNL